MLVCADGHYHKAAVDRFWSWVAEEAFINILGARDMIPELVMALVPIIGATAATMAFLGIIVLIRDWDKKRAHQTISDLEMLASSGGEVFSGMPSNNVSSKDFSRFIVRAGQYRDWPLHVTDPYSGAKIDGAIHRALYYAEVFRAYGYVRGRWRVYQDKKRARSES